MCLELCYPLRFDFLHIFLLEFNLVNFSSFQLFAGSNYNLVGANGQRFAVQQNWNPKTGSCAVTVDPSYPPPPPPPLPPCDSFVVPNGVKAFSLESGTSYRDGTLVTLYTSSEQRGDRSRFESNTPGACELAEISPVNSLKIQWNMNKDSGYKMVRLNFHTYCLCSYLIRFPWTIGLQKYCTLVWNRLLWKVCSHFTSCLKVLTFLTIGTPGITHLSLWRQVKTTKLSSHLELWSIILSTGPSIQSLLDVITEHPLSAA